MDITIIEGRAFTFTVDGQVRNAGVYALNRPDFDIVQAIALAGGADQGVKRIRVVRVLDQEVPEGTIPAEGTAPGDATQAKPHTGTKPADQGPSTPKPAGTAPGTKPGPTPPQRHKAPRRTLTT